jgi:hypothetical protein
VRKEQEMEIVLAILMVLGIYVVVPVLLSFAIAGSIILWHRSKTTLQATSKAAPAKA